MAKHRNADRYLPEDLRVIGIDIHDGPMMDLLDDRIFGALDDNMVRDIADKGVLQTIVCRPSEDGLEVIDGRRRTLHARAVNVTRLKLGLEPLKVPVNVIAADDLKALELQISLNTNRKDESPVTLAKKVAKYVEMLPKGDGDSAIRRAAVAGNCSEQHVRNLCRFAKMDPAIHDAVEKGTLGIGAALVLSADTKEVQVATANAITLEGNGKNVDRAREVRQKLTKDKEPSTDAPKRGRPRSENPKPSQSTLKDVLFLIDMDRRARNMSHGTIPDGFADGIKFAIGWIENVESVEGLSDLLDRANSNEAAMEKKNSKYD